MKGLLILGIAILLLVSAPVTGCANKEQLTEAYNEGYQVGYDEAYTAAYDEAYTAAYDEGHAVGYNEGYSEGRADVKRSMEQSLDELRREMEEACRQVEKPTYGNMFYFYYTPLEDQQYGVDNLEACLNRSWKKEVYEPSLFDCSEMSAFLEWYLENEGWHTVIKTGITPNDSGGKHAWLLVETSAGKYMPVEATQWSVVLWDNPYFDNYFEYSLMEFETIQEAWEYAPTEFDWWASSD